MEKKTELLGAGILPNDDEWVPETHDVLEEDDWVLDVKSTQVKKVKQKLSIRSCVPVGSEKRTFSPGKSESTKQNTVLTVPKKTKFQEKSKSFVPSSKDRLLKKMKLK